MNFPTRTLLFAALALAAGALCAADTASIRIIGDGSNEALQVPLSELQVGESRQLAAESGTPAIVTRTENGLTVEMHGRSTDIPLPDRATIALEHGDGDGARRVKIIHRDHVDGDAPEAGATRLLLRRGDDGSTVHATGSGERLLQRAKGDGEGHAFDAAELEALLGDLDLDAADADGRKVIVIRTVGERSAD
jgi:hypothetical protein